MTLSEGRVYIWEGGEGFADFFHMFIYSYIMIFCNLTSTEPFRQSLHCSLEACCFVCSAGSFREKVLAMPITFSVAQYGF